jgi:aspartyl-tRNA(Asn)/glutamyl-tRNA(Gln) amidotransferase subunit A
MDALTIAARVARREVTALEVVSDTLRAIQANDPRLNAFTEVFAESALRDARALDTKLAAGAVAGPLAGVPFAVKNNYDVAGVVTLAGSKILRDAPPAATDAVLVARLKAAGAILVGALNMDEFAYGFVTENAHYGATRNPHDLSRIVGGSSGGSAAAVAAGLVPLALGSDTNGSIRVPAGLCGVHGLKPTFDVLSCDGVYPFAESLDHAGLFARTSSDIAAAYRVLLAGDAPADVGPVEALCIGVLGGWFEAGAFPDILGAVAGVGQALGARFGVDLPGAEAARSAAFCLSGYEGGRLHAATLAERPQDFDPAVRPRLIAGALLPDAVADRAHAYRAVFAEAARAVFCDFDILLAPATPCVAPTIGQTTMVLDGKTVAMRPNLGIYTQPLSFIGVPVLTAPVNRPGKLPIGVQIIAPWGLEDRLFAVARRLEEEGVIAAHKPGDCDDDQ